MVFEVGYRVVYAFVSGTSKNPGRSPVIDLCATIGIVCPFAAKYIKCQCKPKWWVFFIEFVSFIYSCGKSPDLSLKSIDPRYVSCVRLL